MEKNLMVNLEEDIEQGITFLNGLLWKKDKYYDKVFQQTTEVIDYIFHLFPLKDANVLTVAGSGDQALQAICLGAKKITTFDINPLTYYFSSLKYAAVKALEYDEFMKYFAYQGKYYGRNKGFYFDLYLKIREYLEEDTLMFWDTMYREGNFAKNFENLLKPYNDLRIRSDYSFLKPENYELLKSRINNVKFSFIHADLLDLPLVLDKNEKFDAIFLSNILDWLPTVKDNYKGFIENRMSSFLSKQGKMQIWTHVYADNPFVASAFSDYLNEVSIEGYFKIKERVKVYIYDNNNK